MAVSVFQRVKVQDFDAWLNPDPDAVAAMLKSQGASSVYLTRNVEDPNILMLHMVFPDETTAKTFAEFYAKAAAERHGDTANIQEWWFGVNVEGYCRDL